MFSFSTFLFLAKRSRLFQKFIQIIPWLDHWSILSRRSYKAILQERNLKIIGRDDKYVYAEDSHLKYVGPSDSSNMALSASVAATRRLASVVHNNDWYLDYSPAAYALINNVILCSYREYMPFGNISLRTCDLSINDVFIDIGCFRGYLSLKASAIVGSNGLVYSVDPIEESIAILEKQISLNGLDNIFPLTYACVPDFYNDMTVPFFDAGDGSTSNSLISNYLSVQTKSREVPCICIKDILSQIPKSNFQGKRIVASISTNGTEFQLLEDLVRQSPVSVTCSIPILYTFQQLPKRLSRFLAEFPDALINDSYPWLQVRLEK